MTRVLLAFDKFKDALTARQAGEVVGAILREVRPDWSLDFAPLTDGGEGFSGILTAAAGGRLVPCAVSGPRGERVGAGFGLVPVAAIPPAARVQLGLGEESSPAATVAVIEMAAASGLALLAPEQRDPWHTTTLGTGELMRAAADRGATALLLGVGGSATHDLGLGALAALGFKFTDASGVAVHPPVPACWPQIADISHRMPAGFPPVHLACDVANPLLGPRGAAAAYGPQKGLRPGDQARLEGESARMADMLCRYCGAPATLRDIPGAGAAGGITFGLMAAAAARLVPGFEFVATWLGLDAKLAASDIVVTGEGRFDATSLEGKGPGAIAMRAKALGKEVHVFAGAVAAAAPGLNMHAITPPGTALGVALRETKSNLGAAARRAFAR